MTWETVIGLEVHVQLKTHSKIFSGSPTTFGAEPNTQACAVDLGLPGVLPVLNKAVIKQAISFALAIDAAIANKTLFARKNYFYPDLPKGYQISQHRFPIVGRGTMTITLDNGEERVIGVTRAHLEEDAGKSLHNVIDDMTGIDFNRAGTPLLEVVSEPDLRSAKEAVSYLKQLHNLVRYLDICDGNMQEGSFRCDANVSVRKKGETTLGTRTETKNINSFRFVERAINYEIERQIDRLESGQAIVQETRLYDAGKNETRSMRSKEDAEDYRYFPDPDLLPTLISSDMIAAIKATMPELPKQKKQRFIDQYQLKADEAATLSNNKDTADYFEQTLATLTAEHAKLAANWITGTLSGALNQQAIPLSQSPITPKHLASLLRRITDHTLSGKMAKQVFETMWECQEDADTIIEKQGLKQVTDSALIEKHIDAIIANNPNQHQQYLDGKEKVFGFFVGQVMKETQGKANPAQVNTLLKQKLQSKAPT